ncbi:MAG: response regulator, partial [bacterium]
MNKKILIVDDEADIRKMLKRFFTGLGFKTCEAADGDSALKLVNRIRPSAVLLDIAMPGPDGIEVLRAIRKDHPAIPVIMLTGSSEMEKA